MSGCLHRPDAPCAMCAAAAKATLLLGLAAASPGCTGAVALYGAPIVDEDGDGFEEGLDCDDADDAIHPGADDPEGDGVDQNCDGVDGVADSGM